MSLEKQLIRAIKNRNVGKVRSLLKKGANISAKDDTNRKTSALILATENNDKDIVQLLLSHGADVNAKTNDGMSAIFVAVTKNKDIVKLLLDYGADVNDQFTDFARSNDSTIVRTYTPITFMLMGELNENEKRDKIDILRLLLQAGANPDTTCRYEDANGTILISILLNANPEILFLLLTFGAELKNEDLAIIKKSNDLQSCFTAFEVIKIMPHLGELIKTNIKKENAKAIVEYINNEEQELIKEFRAIEDGYDGSNVPKYLLDTIEHIILKSHINERTQKDKGADAVSLAQKANTFLSKLKDVCQSSSAVPTEFQLEGIEPSAKLQHIER